MPELYRRLPSLDLRQLATALYALAVMKHRPPWTTFMRVYWTALSNQLLLGQQQQQMTTAKGMKTFPPAAAMAAATVLETATVAAKTHDPLVRLCRVLVQCSGYPMSQPSSVYPSSVL